MELLRKELMEEREYQRSIAEIASKKNTLIVLPTGLGKTIIALLVAIKRLKRYPQSKILITAPTRPLCAQHKRTFERLTLIPKEEIILVTGKVKPKKRKELYEKGRVLIATPQCLQNDLKRGILKLTNFSLLVVDEAHRAVKEYSYTFVAKMYKKQSLFPLILGLTASPGGDYERVREVKDNLFIEAVEIRSEKDEDVKKYVKPVKKEWIYVELPEEFKAIRSLLQECARESLSWLKDHGFVKSNRISKKQLLNLQKEISDRIVGGEGQMLYSAARKVAETIKFVYAIELLETQGISSLHEFLNSLKESKKKSDRSILKDPRMFFVFKKVEELKRKGVEHPKMEKLINVIKELIRKNPEIKIIVFANYRTTVERINETLKKNGISSNILIGQASRKGKGLSQKQQIEILRRFSNKEFNVLVATSIGEEGLDIVDTNVAIFYEAVPSEIRTLQRRGRVGRQSPGRLIILLTKKSMDEAFYWAAFHRVRKMKGILYEMREKNKLRKKKTLLDWLNEGIAKNS